MAREVCTGIVAALGVGAVGAVGAAANEAVGPNAHAGDFSRLMANASSAPSQMSTEKIKELLNMSGSQAIEFGLMMKELFSKHARYANVKWRSFLSTIHEKNPEFGIIPSWDEPLNIQVFDAFGAEGHKNVHAGLMLVYKSYFDGKFILLSVDLEGIPVEHIENDEIDEIENGADEVEVSGKQKNALTHTVQIQDGLEEIWQFKGALTIPLVELFNIFAEAMKQSPRDYDILTANCIRFKNLVLTQFENHDASFTKGFQTIPVKSNPTKYLK